MTADYYRNDITLNEALALLLGQNLWQFRRERIDLLEYLERDLADCASELDDARESGDECTIERREQAAEKASEELDRAGDLYTRLCGEIAKIRQGKDSEIVLVEDDPDQNGYDLVVISRQSLLDWADHTGIPVGATHTQTTRRHTTPLLELLDELIGEFWEDYELGSLPTKDLIKAYVREKYGDFVRTPGNNQTECGIPDLSDTVMTAMITMMRPPELRNRR